MKTPKTQPKARSVILRQLIWRAGASMVVCCLLGQSLLAQKAALNQSPGPHYVGESIIVQVALTSYVGDEEVTAVYTGEDERIKVTGPTVGQSTNSYTQIVNGRYSQTTYTNYKFNFQVTSNSEDSIDVGPFILKIGDQETDLGSRTFRFEKLSSDPDLELDITMERDSIYVGEEVPLNIEWYYSGDMNELEYVFSKLEIRSPLFDEFEFKDFDTGKRNRLTLNSAAGQFEIEAEAEQYELKGKQAIKVSGSRMLVAERPGRYEDIISTCRTIRVTRWQRSFFGTNAADSRPAFAAAAPLSFTVKPLPVAGRPKSFSGAVGSGFSIDVTANRSVVRVGDPISLDVSIKGNGNVEKLSLPNFVGADALNEQQFQMPSELPAGSFADNIKQFKINLRVKDEGVTQIPALPFSWFDPKSESFETSYSKPIALQVMETEVATSADVFNPGRVNEEEKTNSPTQLAAKTMSFVGANLAIEKNATRLLASTGVATGWWVAISGYLLSAFAIAVAFLVRKRLHADPAVSELKNKVRGIRSQIASARKQSTKEAAQSISNALRQGLVLKPDRDRSIAENIIAECDNVQYAPNESEAAERLERLAKRALEEFDQIAREL